jgi:hypothetical protein
MFIKTRKIVSEKCYCLNCIIPYSDFNTFSWIVSFLCLRIQSKHNIGLFELLWVRYFFRMPFGLGFFLLLLFLMLEQWFWKLLERKMSFSLHHITCIWYHHDLLVISCTLNTWLRWFLTDFSIVKLLFFPFHIFFVRIKSFILYCIRRKGIRPQLFGEGEISNSLWQWV